MSASCLGNRIAMGFILLCSAAIAQEAGRLDSMPIAGELKSSILVNGQEASEDRPLQITIGQLVRLAAKEDGLIRERIWKVEPNAGDIEFNDDKSRAFFTSPLPGTYTVHCISVGQTAGVSWATIKVELTHSRTNGVTKLKMAEPEAERQTASDVVRRALETVDATSRTRASTVSSIFRGARSLEDAEKQCQKVLAGDFGAWNSFFGEVRGLFAALQSQGYLATEANVRGALTSVAVLIDREVMR